MLFNKCIALSQGFSKNVVTRGLPSFTEFTSNRTNKLNHKEIGIISSVSFCTKKTDETSNGNKGAGVWVDDEDEVKALKTVVAIANQKPLTADENTKATKALFEKLVGVRRRIASKEGKPIFVIFNNKQLEYLAQKKPKTVTELANLKGVGDFKAKKYGPMIIEGINEWIREGRGVVVGPNPFKKREIPTEQAKSEDQETKVVLDGEEAPVIPTKSSITVISSTTIEKPKKRKLMSPEALIKKLEEEGVKLPHEQKQLINIVLTGKNVFVTGSAGTGKSFILREIVKALPATGTVVTASTGIAAVNLGGITTHSFAGVGTGNESIEILIERVKSKKQAVKRWRETQILVIDEISMISSSFFEKLDKVARDVRNNPDEPFGGIQLILCGDFFQLPPVNEPSFAFESEVWDECIQEYVELKQIFRQSDPEFVQHLNQIRVGKCDDSATKRLQECMSSPFTYNDGILPTQLFPRKSSVFAKNTEHLAQLPGEAKIFTAQDGGIEPFLKELQNNCPAPANLELKLNTQVLLVKNIDAKLGLVNGSRGVVTGFSEAGNPIVKFANCEVEVPPVVFSSQIKTKTLAWRKQVPLAHGWALSIHKSQGMTLDRSTISIRDVFQAGQAYVALSRVRSLNCLHLLDFDPKLITVDTKVCQFYEAKFGDFYLRYNNSK